MSYWGNEVQSIPDMRHCQQDCSLQATDAFQSPFLELWRFRLFHSSIRIMSPVFRVSKAVNALGMRFNGT